MAAALSALRAVIFSATAFAHVDDTETTAVLIRSCSQYLAHAARLAPIADQGLQLQDLDIAHR